MNNLRHRNELFARAARRAGEFLDTLPDRPVRPSASFAQVRAALARPLPESGLDPGDAIEALARGADAGLVASAGPRYFGFVIGGSLPAALAADWLTAAWDQNGAIAAASPAATAVEDIVAGWILDLLGLPATATVGFVTGCQMANFVGLAAARHAVLARAGWDVEEHGLAGAPSVVVLVSEEAHATILSALRMLGLGSGRARRVATDGQGRLRADDLRRALASVDGPTIICAQAGNVNTGAFDPVAEIADAAHERGAWLHVDGAFGLWAASCPSRRALTRGTAAADSWATDAHKWLNVPYDSGLAIVRDGAVHRASMLKRAAYLVPAAGADRDNHDFTPESSRRARGFALYAALLSLGRRGLADLVESRCALASRMAERLRPGPHIRILNEVVLNQVLVRFEPPGRDADACTREVIGRVQRDGTCWAGPTHWHGMDAMRISVSGWSTTETDIDRSAETILRVARTVAGANPGG
ncbi:MAG TPA: aminotransferase class V-fold PLP-dependent enzyme [Methylomirabilota bacterium]|nr:aminotransferase class V-fold PLP-dependent enzyme [Methylomirabilota bacterium]